MDIFSKIDDKVSLDEVLDIKAQIAVANCDYAGAMDFYKQALEFVGDDSHLKKEYAEKRDALMEHFKEVKITCPRCGNSVLITDSFCIRCGIRIELKKLTKKRMAPGWCRYLKSVEVDFDLQIKEIFLVLDFFNRFRLE